MNGDDAASEVLIIHALQPSILKHAGKCLLVWKLPYALHQILVAGLVVRHEPAHVGTVIIRQNRSALDWLETQSKRLRLSEPSAVRKLTLTQGGTVQEDSSQRRHMPLVRRIPADLGDDIQRVRIVELSQPRHVDMRELQTEETPAWPQHLQSSEADVSTHPYAADTRRLVRDIGFRHAAAYAQQPSWLSYGL